MLNNQSDLSQATIATTRDKDGNLVWGNEDTNNSLEASFLDIQPDPLSVSTFYNSAIKPNSIEKTIIDMDDSSSNDDENPSTVSTFVEQMDNGLKSSLNTSDFIEINLFDKEYDSQTCLSNEEQTPVRSSNFVANAYQTGTQISDYFNLLRNVGYSLGFVSVAAIAIYANPIISSGYMFVLASTVLVDKVYNDKNYTHLKVALIATPALLLLAVPATYGLILPIVPLILNPLMNPDFGANINRFISAFNTLTSADNRIVNVWNFVTGANAALTTNQALSALAAATTLGYVMPCFQQDIFVAGQNLSETSRNLLKDYIYGIGDNVFKAGKNVLETAGKVVEKCKTKFQQRENDRHELEKMERSWVNL